MDGYSSRHQMSWNSSSAWDRLRAISDEYFFPLFLEALGLGETCHIYLHQCQWHFIIVFVWVKSSLKSRISKTFLFLQFRGELWTTLLTDDIVKVSCEDSWVTFNFSWSPLNSIASFHRNHAFAGGDRWRAELHRSNRAFSTQLSSAQFHSLLPNPCWKC